MRLRIPLTGPFILVVSWLSIGFVAPSVQAQTKAAPARCDTVSGALLQPLAKAQWASVAATSDVQADQLLIALFGAEFTSPTGGVHARIVADVGQRGPFPVLEAALRFHATQAVDLDISLERGILILTNAKKSGAAQIRLRLRAETFDVTLNEPKARLAVEVYGRHVPGPPKLSDPKKDDPVTNIAFFANAGEAVVATAKSATRLHAPPGPALYLWDNVTGTAELLHFKTLPDFARPMDAEERQRFETICGFAKTWAAEPADIAKALERAVASREALKRKAALVALGALDDLPRLMNVLNHSDHADTRDLAILVIRHWLGRQPGQSVRFYEHLTKVEGYTPIQAKNLLHLFNGIEEEKRRQPETYELLIQALNHSKMPARELARWHLVRLAPVGKSIAYDAAGEEAQRREAIAAWRRLIPEGELPPAAAKKTITK